MKNIVKIFMITMIISLFASTVSLGANKKPITSVAVTEIEEPYSESRVLDTEGRVPSSATYRITDVAWKGPTASLSGCYEVTVTLKANVGYIFSGDVKGTINGKNIVGKRLIYEDELSITYAFTENSTSKPNTGSSTSTLIYRVSVYCDKEKGSITPLVIRVRKGNDQTVNIIPNEGYKIKDVKVDGESVGAVSEYTFKDVCENHSISAYFEKIEPIKPLLNALLNFLKTLI